MVSLLYLYQCIYREIFKMCHLNLKKKINFVLCHQEKICVAWYIHVENEVIIV